MLAMISMIPMLLVTMGMTLIQAYLIQNRAAAGLATSFVVLSSTGSLLRATAVALRLIAVFTGRQRQMSGFEIPLAARAASQV